MKKTIIFSILALALSGCALIFKGQSQSVTFASNPTGAKVIIDGIYKGDTTLTTKLDVAHSYSVVIKKDGFADSAYHLTNHIGSLWIILDLLSSGPGLIIDAVTGAWYEFDSTNVNIELTPEKMKHTPLPKGTRSLLIKNGLKASWMTSTL